MNGKRLIVIVSLLIIIVGGTVLLLRLKQDNSDELAKETNTEKYEITEQDYMENPKYILEETIVSDGKHFQYPQVQQVWNYIYFDKRCHVGGVLELSEEQYDGVIKQLDNDLNIPRYEESQYKDKKLRNGTAFVDNKEDAELDNRKRINRDEAEVTYCIKVPDCKYQTQYKGQTVMCIFMTKKYDKYYMFFCSDAEFRCF